MIIEPPAKRGRKRKEVEEPDKEEGRCNKRTRQETAFVLPLDKTEYSGDIPYKKVVEIMQFKNLLFCR